MSAIGVLNYQKNTIIVVVIIGRQDESISQNAKPLIVDHPFANIDIDTIQDLEYAEYLFNKSH